MNNGNFAWCLLGRFDKYVHSKKMETYGEYVKGASREEGD